MKTALVAYGSTRGATAEIAAAVADTLRGAGIVVDCVPVEAVHDLGRYDAVIVGGAMSARRWHRDASRFVARHSAALRRLPVWMFSSESCASADASGDDARSIPQVDGLLRRVGARGHVTFGDRGGFIASAMARTSAGELRDFSAISAWSARRASDIATLPCAVEAIVPGPPSRVACAGVGTLGCALLAWIAADVASVRAVTGLTLATLCAAVAILAGALRRHRRACV